jgi:hypothetical protein
MKAQRPTLQRRTFMAKHWKRGLAASGTVILVLVLTALIEARAQSPDQRDVMTVQGKVESFSTAPRGEVDGAVLDDGTAIHWPPHLGDRISSIIAKGDRVRATGWMETGPRGDTHLEIEAIKNLSAEASFDRSDGPLPPRAGPRGSRGGNVEERVRALEERVDQLFREVERLRKDR